MRVRMRMRAREQRWCMLHAYVRAHAWLRVPVHFGGCIRACKRKRAFMHACACVHVARSFHVGAIAMGCSSSPESSLRLAAADVLYEAHAYRAALDAFRAVVDSDSHAAAAQSGCG